MWSRQGQQERFVSVLAALDPQPGETLLDYGCGTGALADLLPVGVFYTGYDWSDGMVDRARRDHQGQFYSTTPPSYPFDLVACIGPFNLADGWSQTQTWKVLSDLWGRCNRKLAVCLYAGADPDCLVYSMGGCQDFAEQTGADWLAIRHLPNDILLTLDRGAVRR